MPSSSGRTALALIKHPGRKKSAIVTLHSRTRVPSSPLLVTSGWDLEITGNCNLRIGIRRVTRLMDMYVQRTGVFWYRPVLKKRKPAPPLPQYSRCVTFRWLILRCCGVRGCISDYHTSSSSRRAFLGFGMVSLFRSASWRKLWLYQVFVFHTLPFVSRREVGR